MSKIVRNIPDGLEASYADIKLDTISDLVNLTGTPPDIVWVSGYHTKGDGSYGSHIFEWSPDSTEPHNGGTIIELGATFPTDGSDQTQLDAWFTYSGGTTGRYKLKYDGVVNVKWFGANSSDSIVAKTTKIQQAIDSISNGKVLVEADLNGRVANLGFYDYYDTNTNIALSNLSNTENIEIILLDRGTETIVMNGHNSAGIVNEKILKGSGFHQGLVIDSDNRLPSGTKGAGQVESNKTSLVFRNNSVSKWQISNDMEALKHDGLTIYKNNPSKQMIHFNESGKIRINKRASTQDFSEPSYDNSICGSSSFDTDSDRDLLIAMRLLEAGKLEGATPSTNGTTITGNEASVAASHYLRINNESKVFYEGNLLGINRVISPTGNIRYGNRGFTDITEPLDNHTFNGNMSLNSTVGHNIVLSLRTIANGVSDSANTPTKECKFIYVQATGELRFYSTDKAAEAVTFFGNGNVFCRYGVSGGANATASRPTGINTGTMFFDTTLNKPIWWNGTEWVDATGTTV